MDPERRTRPSCFGGRWTSSRSARGRRCACRIAPSVPVPVRLIGAITQVLFLVLLAVIRISRAPITSSGGRDEAVLANSVPNRSCVRLRQPAGRQDRGH